MKKILCLTDFSENAAKGIAYANELAKEFSATLLFMHTYELCCDNESQGSAVHPSQIAFTDTESREKLSEICMNFMRENKYSKVSYEYVVREGKITKSLNSIVQERKIDLVVCSVEGILSPENNNYGKVVSEIVQESDCPVLIVPTNCTYRPIQTIVYAYDVQSGVELNKDAVSFSNEFSTTLKLVSLVEPSSALLNEKLIDRINGVKAKDTTIALEGEVLPTNEKIEALTTYLTEKNADVVILETHVHKVFATQQVPSFSRAFIFCSPIPLLICKRR